MKQLHINDFLLGKNSPDAVCISTKNEDEKNSGDRIESTEVQRKIKEECDELADFLIEKNKSYGNSAFEPLGMFAKRVDPLAQI
ncbi:MAG: hypothetical protein GWO41_00915, partial [candidate division Zixibacteria bacterium]|nr:hypothetical protein [candidate division Zixibacteria bacterium]NIR63780.1 hypothetical protein [candidate division Zixibacteria bacterium]NIS45739.1 hypothetical protein [candidate division Zixibacteria bacterium]NIT51342.1 hypothetical protein [candidate division Zixibacteria bacterium]NIU13861.1 hypothetical protein [candidate division Zixibacteria bacterium]